MMPKTRDPQAPVAVIIVNWNGVSDTLDVLLELDEVEGPPLRIIVVDNGSTDSSVETLRRERPEVDLVETGENLGFAGGNLAGIRHALEYDDTGWILLINNDVAVEKGFLLPLIEACADPGIGAAAPKIYYFEPDDLIWAAGGKLRLRETVTEEFGQGQPDGPAFSTASDMTYLTTCCLLIPRDAMERVGPLDPLYFIGVDDADWCRRALNAGFRLRYVPESRIWHKVAVSTGGSYAPFKTFHTGRSNTLYARRHFGALGLLAFLGANGLGLVAAMMRELFGGNPAAVLAKAKGVWRGLRDPLSEPPRL
jgi:GT2 family glycosyltransferase